MPLIQAIDSDERYQLLLQNKFLDLLKLNEINRNDDEFNIAMDLVEKILKPNPLERLSLEEILLHPFMQIIQE